MKSSRESSPPAAGIRSGRLDTIFEALSHRYRRYVLYCLRERGAVPVTTLVDRVADIEDRYGAATADRDDVRVALRQSHLPKLADQGIVTVDEGVADLADSVADREAVLSEVDLARERELGGDFS